MRALAVALAAVVTAALVVIVVNQGPADPRRPAIGPGSPPTELLGSPRADASTTEREPDVDDPPRTDRVASTVDLTIEVLASRNPAAKAEARLLRWTPEIDAQARGPTGIPHEAIASLLERHQTDRYGRVRVEKPTYPLYVCAAPDGHQPRGALLESAPDTGVISLDCPPSTPLDVTVRDPAGTAVVGAKVTAQANFFADWYRGKRGVDNDRVTGMLVRFEATTDANGKCRFTSLADGDNLLAASASSTSAEEDYAVLPWNREIEFTLHLAGTIRGTVLDALTGQAVPGAVAASYFATQQRDDLWCGRVTTNARGGFEISTRANATAFGVRVVATGYATYVERHEAPRAGEERYLEVHLAPEAAVEGVVMGPDGDAVAGATVQAWRSDNGDWLGMDLSASDGSYRIIGLDPRHRYAVIAAKEGYGRHDVASVAPGRIDLHLGRVARLRGRVVADSLTRLEGSARIIRRNRDGSEPHTVSIDPESGAFESQEIIPGEYRVDVFVRGAAPLFAEVVVDAGESVLREFALEAGAPLAGRVVDAASGNAVAGAVIRLGDANERGRVHATFDGVEATTDAHGNFELEHVPTKSIVMLVAEANGFAPSWVAVTPPFFDATVLRLERPSTLVIRHVGPTSLTSGFSVQVSGDSIIAQTRTSAFGDPITFENLSAGLCDVYIHVRQEESFGAQVMHREATLVTGATRTVEFSIGEPGRVLGRVLTSGPLTFKNRYFVTASSPSEPSRSRHVDVSPDGTFEIRGLEADTYDFVLRHLSSNVHHVARRVLTVVEGIDQRLDLEVRATGIRGVVRLSSGDAGRGATVRYQRAETASEDRDVITDGSTRTRGDGAYEAIGLHPGLHGVIVEAPGHATARGYVDVADSGEPTKLDFTLVREAAIRVRVRDADGGPVANAELFVVPENTNDFPWFRSLFTDESGCREVPALHAGKYRVTPMRAGFFPTREWIVTRTGQMAHVEATMRRGLALEVRLGDDAIDCTVQVRDVSTGETLDVWLARQYCKSSTGSPLADASGRLVLEPVPADLLEVTANGKTLEVDLGESDGPAVVSFVEDG